MPTDLRPTTLTDTIADDLRARIYAGELEPGERLASEPELMAWYEVSRTTVRRSLQQLIHEGLVASRQGLGYHVRAVTPLPWVASRPERNTRTDISPADAWSTGVREQGRRPHEEIDVAIVRPPARVAEQLRLPMEAPVVVRRRLRYVDDEPMLLADSYYPEHLVQGTKIACPGDALPGAYAVLDELRRGWVRSRDEISIRMPTRDETGKLALAAGTPVAEHIRTSWSANNRPVRTQVCVLPGDRNTIVYELEER